MIHKQTMHGWLRSEYPKRFAGKSETEVITEHGWDCAAAIAKLVEPIGREAATQTLRGNIANGLIEAGMAKEDAGLVADEVVSGLRMPIAAKDNRLANDDSQLAISRLG